MNRPDLYPGDDVTWERMNYVVTTVKPTPKAWYVELRDEQGMTWIVDASSVEKR